MRIVETMQKADWAAIISRATGVALLLAGVLLAAGLCAATPRDHSVTCIFDSHFTPAQLLFASILYLPVLFALLALGKK
jgi:hypothetical protein